MRLRRARVQNYRSVKDSGWFELEADKTILVGPNEGGKTAILRALEQLNPGPLTRPLDALRDFPRSDYHRIRDGSLQVEKVVVAEGVYEPDPHEQELLAGFSPAFAGCTYYRAVLLDNSVRDRVLDAPDPPAVDQLDEPLLRLVSSVRGRLPDPPAGAPLLPNEPGSGESATEEVRIRRGLSTVSASDLQALMEWVETVVAPDVAPEDAWRAADLAKVRAGAATVLAYLGVLREFRTRLPSMVYASTYPSVNPELHLGHLADAVEAGAVDATDEHNFGSFCLLQVLGYTARELSDLGKAPEPGPGDQEAFERYRVQLDERDVMLNIASRKLTEQVRDVWEAAPGRPDGRPGTEYAIRITADQQYLKVAVEDTLGVRIELDQRSHGFQWLLSFLVVFFAQASDPDRRAVLLLDEPGLSLHGRQQRAFRKVLTRLGQSNQLVFTTHSPFLVGGGEVDRVRVVEVADGEAGTKVRADLAAEDPASLVPLRQAIVYDLARSLLGKGKVLLLERVTDYWYIEATAALLGDAQMAALGDDVALVPAPALARLVYLAPDLDLEGLEVAALLDADASGPHAEAQQVLVERLGVTRVLRTQDVYEGPVPAPTVEELLRPTLLALGRDLGWHAGGSPEEDPADGRPVTEVLAEAAGADFSPRRLAKAYVEWAAEHRAADLRVGERVLWMAFLERVNRVLA